MVKLMQNFRSPTNRYYYVPIKFTFNRISSFIRIWVWGFCPECNSDAPKLYNCKVCEYDTTSPFNKKKKKEYWNNWKWIEYEKSIHTERS